MWVPAAIRFLRLPRIRHLDGTFMMGPFGASSVHTPFDVFHTGEGSMARRGIFHKKYKVTPMDV